MGVVELPDRPEQPAGDQVQVPRVGDRVVVVAPDLLLTALCRSIASFAIERASVQNLADAFRGAVATSVAESLEHLDLPPGLLHVLGGHRVADLALDGVDGQ